MFRASFGRGTRRASVGSSSCVCFQGPRVKSPSDFLRSMNVCSCGPLSSRVFLRACLKVFRQSSRLSLKCRRLASLFKIQERIQELFLNFPQLLRDFAVLVLAGDVIMRYEMATKQTPDIFSHTSPIAHPHIFTYVRSSCGLCAESVGPCFLVCGSVFCRECFWVVLYA